MRQLIKWGIILTAIIPMVAFGQLRNGTNEEIGLRDQLGLPSYTSNGLLLGFIDMSRIQFNHSYSLSMISGGGNAQSLGLFTSQFSYAVNPKLSLAGTVGWLHSPLGQFSTSNVANSNPAQFSNSPLQNGQLFWQGEVLYRPTENTAFHISYNNFPYQRYYNPWLWGMR